MQNHSSTQQLRKSGAPGFLSALTAMLLCLMWTTGAKAQLSGTYTIGSSGTYKTFADAIADLNSVGVSGPVLFNVAAGTYSETISFGSIKNASSINTITFRGAGRSKTMLTSGGQTVTFSSSIGVTLDQMNISTTNTGGALVYSNSDQDCGITNSNITAPTSSSVYMVQSNYATRFTLHNNYVYGGYYGFYTYSNQSNSSFTQGFSVCTNNRFIKTGYCAIFAYQGAGNIYNSNVIDSSSNTLQYAIFTEYETGATYNANQVIAPSYYCMFNELCNYYAYSKSVPFTMTNNFFSNFIDYGAFYIPEYNLYPCIFAHNTVYNNNGIYGLFLEAIYCPSNSMVLSNNIFYSAGSNVDLYLYVYGSTSPQPFSSFDGNDIYTTGGPYAYFYNGSSSSTYSDFASYSKAMQSFGWEQNCTNINPNFIKAPNNLHLDQGKPAPSGVYVNVDFDIDGDARCKLFPTAGADESAFGKTKPVVKWFVPTNAYPNSPSLFYQTAKAGEPKIHQWYIMNSAYGDLSAGTYYKIPHSLGGDSVTLKTSLLTTGKNCIRLETTACGGVDSYDNCFNVAAPTAVPNTDFISNKNTVQAGDIVTFKDLSSNGPVKWDWSISPDSTFTSGVKVPSFKYMLGSSSYQNPQVKFLYGGKYKICLTASNGVGKGSTVCKTNYINVIPAVNMGSTPVVHDAQGYLYDNGGPNGSYVRDAANGYVETMLIDPCADSVYLTFSVFDMYCGYDYVRLFEGRNNSGKNLTGKCATNGTFFTGGGGGNGFTGGKAYPGCTYQCMPNVVKPDTFRAKSSMWVEMSTYEGFNLGAGFAAYWWSKPRVATKPKAAFTSSNNGDSVCVNAAMNFTNTTKIDPNDPASFFWDLDGDITTFECVGNCTTTSYPYFLPGAVTVTLIATNCGGSDTATKTLTVYNPKAPVAQFTADNTSPTTNDVVFFTSTVPQCVDDYVWTIARSTGNPTAGTAVYLNGTSASSANPQVNFTDTGYYDVTLYVDNASGANNSKKVLTKYIHVRAAYCIPSVAVLNSGLGITAVKFNTLTNKTTQAAQEYTNNAVNSSLTTTIAVGATYPITISRDASLIFEPINRTVYIDWNGDGSFVGKGEIVASDSNSYSSDFTANVKVPRDAKIGATIMRIATNRGTYANKPCGQNEFGEYQDYRVYVTPYNILPVITLKGHQGLKDTIKIEQGNPFIEEGYSASSFLYGDITKNVKLTNTFNNLIPGVYVFAYNVVDSATPVANKAITKYRIVQVTPDVTPPTLIVASPDTIYIEVTAAPTHPIPAPKVISADDLVDGPLAGSVIVDTNKVQTNIVGTYVVTYTVSDLDNNTAVVYRVIKVIDTIRPVLKLIGSSTVTVEVFGTYNEQGVSATDNYYNAAQLNGLIVTSGNVDVTKLGSYTVTYNLTDPSGNIAATITRTVNVVDTQAPVVSLNGVQTDSVEVFKQYNDPGVTMADNYDANGELNVAITGTFYAKFTGGRTNATGTYTIIYTITDKSGNHTTVTRNVKVQDRTAPVITLKGDAALSVCRWFNYVDAGYTVTDNYDKTIPAANVTTEGSFYTNGGTTMSGLLTLRYKAVDASNNVGYSEWRYIQVKPETDFTCASGIETGAGLDKNINVYPNPNTGIFTISANLPAQEKVRMSVTNALGQEIAVIHNGVLGTNSFQVDLSNQSAGIYLLNIVSGNQTLTKRIEIAK